MSDAAGAPPRRPGYNLRRPWAGGELECVAVIPETANVRTFQFRDPAGGFFHFLAGQFLTLEVPVAGAPLHRTFTIASPPTRPETVSLTLKAHPHGTATRWLFDQMTPGRKIRAIGPAGVFVWQTPPGVGTLFVSAGSGVTPMMAMARERFDLGDPADMVFLHVARTPDDVIFRRELDLLSAQGGNFQPILSVDLAPAGQSWSGPRGLFNPASLATLCPDYRARQVYCCGPAGFMTAVKNWLIANGLPPERYCEESFAPPDAPAVSNVEPATGWVISVEGESRTALCGPDETLLSALGRVGIVVPSACRMGLCGTCLITKVSGDSITKHDGGISDEELAEGKILACCTKPLGPVTVRLG